MAGSWVLTLLVAASGSDRGNRHKARPRRRRELSMGGSDTEKGKLGPVAGPFRCGIMPDGQVLASLSLRQTSRKTRKLLECRRSFA
ncbi:hypothetical protein GCM10007363_23990 [Pseudomonas fluvialis]|uniref:Secreted protein n=1 Tax=Pseudomonas fluvialis TaxID=1793966 RepID=A0ABQ2ASR3_9PSED|nr:hypothetical protein GCM10007363_23990 [Pseudomonas fluvialis]